MNSNVGYNKYFAHVKVCVYWNANESKWLITARKSALIAVIITVITNDFEFHNGCQPYAINILNSLIVLALLFATTVALAVLLWCCSIYLLLLCICGKSLSIWTTSLQPLCRVAKVITTLQGCKHLAQNLTTLWQLC